ncbi:MAG: hypothetical protein JSS49_07420 [Planctomycetes bacterium]|nr:hypothetical protein [Planctomycetota bacterium]
MLSRRMAWLFTCGTAAGFLCSFAPQDGYSEVFRKRAPVRSGLPAHVPYGQDRPATIVAITSDAAVEEQVLLVLNTPTLVPLSAPESYPWQASAKPSADSVLNRPSFSPIIRGGNSRTDTKTVVETSIGPDGTAVTKRLTNENTESGSGPMLAIAGQHWSAQPPDVLAPAMFRRKSFSLKQPSLQADNVTLDRIGLAIYETGHVALTGLVSDTGGQDGLTKGSDITIRVRGYGMNRLNSPTLPNGPLHFEMSSNCRVLRGRSDAISLVPLRCSETVREHYDEITHLEVVLESRRSK